MTPAAPSDETTGSATGLAERRARRLAGLVVLAFALGLVWNLSGRSDTPRGGWDETTHLELPAARVLVALGAGQPGLAFEAVHDCHQYPFVAPLFLAATQSLFGLSEAVARWSVVALWIGTLVGLVVLGSRIAERGPGAALRLPAALVALLVPVTLAFVSPLGTRYAGTLFLEVPVACASIWTLVFWLRRRAKPSLARDVLAGTWVALTFFTKFNYGVLLAAGLGLSFVVEQVALVRSTGPGATAAPWRRSLRSLAGLALVPAVACTWWFILPLPDGFARAAQHRASFWEYLVAARGGTPIPWDLRLLDWAGGVSPNPVLLALTSVGVLASLRQLSRPVVRTLWCVLVASGPAVWFHSFHLDRLLLPGSLVLWLTAGAGWCGIAAGLERWSGRRALLSGLLAVSGAWLLAILFPVTQLADGLGVLSEDPELRAYQEAVLRGRGWTGRIPSAGLRPAEHAQLVDWIEAELAPVESFAWIGVSSELSPASIHLELLARGGDKARFLRDAARQVDVTPVPGMPDPDWSTEQLRAFLAPFDVVFVTHPPDLKDRPGARAMEDRYQRPLIDEFDCAIEQLGEVDIVNSPGDPVRATLYALRQRP